MANYLYYTIIFIMFLGGFLGWSLFFYTIFQTFCSRKKEMELIKEIGQELKQVKSEIEKLK